MQLTNLPLLTLTLLTTLTTATPVPASNPFLEARALCTAAQEALAEGINNNIAIQNQELASIDGLANILAAKNPNANAFAVAKAQFITVIKSGVTVRENNQKIAPKGSPALAGLAKVQGAQAAELKLAEGLTGKGATDNANIATLKSDFQGGIKQNQQNAKDALAGCTR